jgi:hypothetical protein
MLQEQHKSELKKKTCDMTTSLHERVLHLPSTARLMHVQLKLNTKSKILFESSKPRQCYECIIAQVMGSVCKVNLQFIALFALPLVDALVETMPTVNFMRQK